jgi:hypothetical protein
MLKSCKFRRNLGGQPKEGVVHGPNPCIHYRSLPMPKTPSRPPKIPEAPRPPGPKTPLPGRPFQLVLFSPLPMIDEHVKPPPPILPKSGAGTVLGFFIVFFGFVITLDPGLSGVGIVIDFFY